MTRFSSSEKVGVHRMSASRAIYGLWQAIKSFPALWLTLFSLELPIPNFNNDRNLVEPEFSSAFRFSGQQIFSPLKRDAKREKQNPICHIRTPKSADLSL